MQRCGQVCAIAGGLLVLIELHAHGAGEPVL